MPGLLDRLGAAQAKQQESVEKKKIEKSAERNNELTVQREQISAEIASKEIDATEAMKALQQLAELEAQAEIDPDVRTELDEIRRDAEHAKTQFEALKVQLTEIDAQIAALEAGESVRDEGMSAVEEAANPGQGIEAPSADAEQTEKNIEAMEDQELMTYLNEEAAIPLNDAIRRLRAFNDLKPAEESPEALQAAEEAMKDIHNKRSTLIDLAARIATKLEKKNPTAVSEIRGGVKFFKDKVRDTFSDAMKKLREKSLATGNSDRFALSDGEKNMKRAARYTADELKQTISLMNVGNGDESELNVVNGLLKQWEDGDAILGYDEEAAAELEKLRDRTQMDLPTERYLQSVINASRKRIAEES